MVAEAMCLDVHALMKCVGKGTRTIEMRVGGLLWLFTLIETDSTSECRIQINS